MWTSLAAEFAARLPHLPTWQLEPRQKQSPAPSPPKKQQQKTTQKQQTNKKQNKQQQQQQKTTTH